MDKLLTDWGFPELIPVFQENEIDQEAVLQLNDGKVLETIIPKIGPRIKLMAKIRQYQNIMNSEVFYVEEENVENINLQSVTPSDASTSSALTSPSASTSSAYTSDEEEHLANQSEVKKAFETASKRQLPFYGEVQFKKACREVHNLDIQQFLGLSVLGKYVLNTYRKENRLSRKTRNQLTSLLINGLMSQDWGQKLLPIDFQILAEKITELFPTESKHTYYIPRIPGNKRVKPINPKGKLIDKYRNLCRTYNLTKNDVSAVDSMNEYQICQTDDNGLLENKLWLTKFQEPWDLVIEKWKDTFPLRKADRSATLAEFISNWPILKHPEAYSLINNDFKALFPNCDVSLHSDPTKWNIFFEKLRKVSPAESTTEEFLCTLSNDINQDSKTAIQLAALSMLCPPKCRIKCSQKTLWKPSILECQESLINLVPNCGIIQECIDTRKNKLAVLKLTIQPYIIVVGSSYSQVTDSYLVVDDNYYRTYSVLHGIDFAFKTFHSLNASYPKESEHIWLIIEKCLYKVQSSEVQIPAVLTLIKDLEENI